jgi:hypothetical protein
MPSSQLAPAFYPPAYQPPRFHPHNALFRPQRRIRRRRERVNISESHENDTDNVQNSALSCHTILPALLYWQVSLMHPLWLIISSVGEAEGSFICMVLGEAALRLPWKQVCDLWPDLLELPGRRKLVNVLVPYLPADN